MGDPSLITLALLIAAALFAGWIDAAVGGGGLVQLPALVVAFPQAVPVHLLATNKLASFCGTSVSAATYARRIRPDPATVIPLALAAFTGSCAGAFIASHIPKAAFNPIILIALIAVGAYTLLKPDLGKVTQLRFDGRRHQGAAVLLGLLIGCYDGVLGPGTGSFFVFALVGWVGYHFLQATATTKIANGATNLAALVVFTAQGAVHWKIGLMMGAANLVGGYFGSRTAMARGSGFVRGLFVVVVGAFIIRIGWDVVAQLRG